LATIYASRHHLKFHRSADEEEIWKYTSPGDSVADQESPELPWWNALNASMI
jgi:hypothetical protein